MKHPLAILLFALAVTAAPAARAQVRASLVAEDASIQPGRPFTVALRLVHEAHWHTYWVNPGTGIATSIEWALPPGWTAGPIQWPAPKVLVDPQGTIIGNGYDGDLLLPVSITPPAALKAGGVAEIKATASWLMCNDVCKPGSAEVSVKLPVSAAAVSDPQWAERIRSAVKELPAKDEHWKVAASKDGKTIRLVVDPVGAADARRPKALHFFSEDNLVGYELPQTAADDGRGGFVLTLSVSPDGPADATRLVGVLASENGWRADGSLPGLRIEAPLKSEGAKASESAPGGTQGAGGLGLGGALALAFVGGLILNLMPCVFPVLGIKILGFVNQAGTERRKVAGHGLLFSLGVLLSFWTLAGLLAVLRKGGSELGWGFQLQSPAFVFALAVGLLVFALNLSGVFEFGLSATGFGSGLQSKTGYAGSFLTGVLATVVATPCSAPFLAPALGAALTLSTAESFAIFTAIAIGLSTPYLLLSIFPGAIRVLPRPGAWMETFKQLMAFPLYATVGYLVWVLAGQVPEGGLLNVFFGLVLVAMAVWAYGRFHAPGSSPGRARFGTLALISLVGLGVWTGWPDKAAPGDLVWEKWSPETVDGLRRQGRIVYVDFTARWCATCQANKKVVFHSGEVLQAFRDKHIATLRGDWTNQDPQITAELAKYHRSAVPFNVIWLPGRNDPAILPPLLTPGIVLKAVADAR